jgi:hypothetical protein
LSGLAVIIFSKLAISNVDIYIEHNIDKYIYSWRHKGKSTKYSCYD